MGLINYFKNFFKKPKPILNPEDITKLNEIKRQSYMEEAEKLIKEKAKDMAKEDMGIKQKKDDF
jgi:hypothetical protein